MDRHPSSPGNGGLLSGDDSVSPQVCDRCRTKKVGCDGVRPKCGNCTASNAECTVSVRLRRKTKPRRYTERKDELIKRLRADNQMLQNHLNIIGTATSPVASPQNTLPSGVPGYQDLQQMQQLPKVQQHFGGHETTPNSGSDPRPSLQCLPDPVIKHLGRLVSTDSGIDRFAGSTTGVHFIHSAEQKYQHLFNSAEMFPQCVFRLHMLPQPKNIWRLPNPQPQGLSQRLGLTKTRSHYSYKLDRFFKRWSTTCPVLSPRQMYQGFHRIMDYLEANSQDIPHVDMPNLHQLYLILAINAWDDSDDVGDTLSTNAMHYFELSRQTESLTSETGDLSSLQSLLLTSLYFQLSGQHSFLAQTSGAAVRLAQSLGLHRHTRRFKFCAGESEMRNRVWWCVYILDMISSVSHGLPKLINDADVDTDLPLDCDFDDMTLKELPLSLPGEATRFSNFLLYLRLARIISNTVRLLYTTTLRRGAVEKIQTLERELHVWEHTFNQSLRGIGLSPYDPPDSQSGNQAQIQGNSVEDQTFLIPYLQLLSNVALLMIHQPALTFGPEFPQFKKSLMACTQSCMQVITIFDNNKNERRIFYLQPSSTRLIFQSALMCLYFSWHKMSKTSNGDYVEDTSTLHVPISPIIGTAISLFEVMRSEWLATSSHESSSTSDAFSSTITLLRRLETQTLHRSLPSDSHLSNLRPAPVNDTDVLWQQQMIENHASDDLCGLSGLEGVNQLDISEWSADYFVEPLDSYLEFPAP